MSTAQLYCYVSNSQNIRSIKYILQCISILLIEVSSVLHSVKHVV